jgi:hypothetical protein
MMPVGIAAVVPGVGSMYHECGSGRIGEGVIGRGGEWVIANVSLRKSDKFFFTPEE